MKNKLTIIFPVLIITLFCVAALKGVFAFLLFPAVAVLLYYLVAYQGQKQNIKILIIGICLFIAFGIWQYIFTKNFDILQVAIYSMVIVGAFEAWSYASSSASNLWGLMNLIVFYIGLEYLMIEWLPYDISHWILGAPFLENNTVSSWILYAGFQGLTLWIWLAGLLLYKAFSKKNNYIFLVGAMLLIVLPVIFSPEASENTSLYAQGEWLGRTCIWLSLLIFAFSFVKRRTRE